MMEHVHWWLAALSFVMGLALTFALMVRPANTRVPQWASLGLGVIPEPPVQEVAPAEPSEPEPAPPAKKPSSARRPAMKVGAAEAPTEQIPVIRPRPAKKKAASKDQPTKRIPVLTDPETERIPVVKRSGAKGVPAKKKAPGKRVPAKKIPPKKRPAPRKTPVVDDAPTTELPLMKYSPYGPGSARANLDGSGPEGWTVKGRTDSRLYFSPGDPGYDETEAQVWFENPEFATKAFFMSSRKRARKP